MEQKISLLSNSGKITNVIFYKEILDTHFNPNKNKNLLQYNLYPSYVITWVSTGIPRLKWQLGKKEFVMNIENKFAYIVTENPTIASEFEGGSGLRGS